MCAFTITSNTGEIKLPTSSLVLVASFSGTKLTIALKLVNRYHIVNKEINWVFKLRIERLSVGRLNLVV